MSSISDVTVTINKQTPSLTRAGFGMPIIVGYHTKFANRVNTYSLLSELVTAGFALTDPIYLAAQAMLSQSPRPKQFKVGRRALAPTQKHSVTPEAKNSTKYTAKINTTPYEFTSDATASIAEICAGLVAAVNAAAWQALTAYALGDHVANGSKIYVCRVAGTSAASGGPTGTSTAIVDATCKWDYLGVEQAVTAADSTTYFTLTADVAGVKYTLEVSDDAKEGLLSVEDTTADAGIATDLTAIETEDAEFYGLCIADAQGAAEIAAAAAWAETRRLLYVYVSGDTDAKSAVVTDDIFSTLAASAYDRSVGEFHHKPHQYLDAAILGRMLPTTPGSATWAHKSLSGVAVDTLATGELAALEAKYANHFVAVGGTGRHRYGYAAGGEWADVTRLIDWAESGIQEDVYDLLASNEKVPFTQQGAGAVGNAVLGVLKRGVRNGGFAEDPEPTVTVPDVLDTTQVTTANRQARLLPGVKASAKLAGAIHKVTVTFDVAV